MDGGVDDIGGDPLAAMVRRGIGCALVVPGPPIHTTMTLRHLIYRFDPAAFATYDGDFPWMRFPVSCSCGRT